MTRSSRKGRRLQKKQSLLTKILNAIMKHLASLGFTNRLAIYILLFLAAACSIVLSKIVHKSEVENSSADGEGIKYATAKANNFGAAEDINSPAI